MRYSASVTYKRQHYRVLLSKSLCLASKAPKTLILSFLCMPTAKEFTKITTVIFKKEKSFIFNYFADEIPVSLGNDADS